MLCSNMDLLTAADCAVPSSTCICRRHAVRSIQLKKGDARGDLAFVTLATARQAAMVVERLQGTMVGAQQGLTTPACNFVEGRLLNNHWCCGCVQPRLPCLLLFGFPPMLRCLTVFNSTAPQECVVAPTK